MKTLKTEMWAAAAVAAADLDFGTFAAGEGRGESDLDIDPIFGKDLAAVLCNAAEDGVVWAAPVPDAQLADLGGYVLAEVRTADGDVWGVAAWDANGACVGAYTGSDLSVDVNHQGKGLGAALAAWRFALDGAFPVWWHDTPAYSPAGIAAHRRAWIILSETQP